MSTIGRSAKLAGALLATTMLSLGATTPIAPAADGAVTAIPTAHAARTVTLHETGRLRLTSKHNFTLNERGTASGTVAGQIYVHLTAVSTSRVTAEVNIYAGGDSISGQGSGSYHREGTIARFSGSISFDRGTGKYARVHGSGLGFDGTIQESNADAITVQVNGSVSD